MIKDAIGRLTSNIQQPSYKIDDVVQERCSRNQIKGRQVIFQDLKVFDSVVASRLTPHPEHGNYTV
jgi:hypothetical protein